MTQTTQSTPLTALGVEDGALLTLRLKQWFKARVRKGDVLKVYSGLPGCGCGCKGKYSSSPISIGRIFNTMAKRIDEMKITAGLDGDIILSVEDDKNYRWMYLPASMLPEPKVDPEGVPYPSPEGQVWRQQLFTKEWYLEAEYTPGYMSPSSEAYWSM